VSLPDILHSAANLCFSFSLLLLSRYKSNQKIKPHEYEDLEERDKGTRQIWDALKSYVTHQ